MDQTHDSSTSSSSSSPVTLHIQHYLYTPTMHHFRPNVISLINLIVLLRERLLFHVALLAPTFPESLPRVDATLLWVVSSLHLIRSMARRVMATDAYITKAIYIVCNSPEFLACCTLIRANHNYFNNIGPYITSNATLDWKYRSGGGRNTKFDGAGLFTSMYDSNGLTDIEASLFVFELQCTLNDVEAALLKKKTFVAVDVALHELVPHLT
ncbi:hypothetical protein B0H17DRAFT_1131115 [Mycena rosella]|uniref:Uncharacterized protein n=1 Tax=Mycena rosella TaxID=1033263 RepID=A0AAD7DNB6_MYCRO|nr:hypothetical protein B0H17DRAFT_1131115 [Mycena rosella]